VSLHISCSDRSDLVFSEEDPSRAPELQEEALEEARQTVKKECLEGETEKTKEFC